MNKLKFIVWLVFSERATNELPNLTIFSVSLNLIILLVYSVYILLSIEMRFSRGKLWTHYGNPIILPHN